MTGGDRREGCITCRRNRWTYYNTWTQLKAKLKPLPHVSASLVERREDLGICEAHIPGIATIALRLQAALQASRTPLSSKPNEIAAHYILDACGRRDRYSKAIWGWGGQIMVRSNWVVLNASNGKRKD
jgi:hypothetical protein